MRQLHLHRPATMLVALLAALTTWSTLFSWRGLVDRPGDYLVPSLLICLLVAVSGALLRAGRVPALLVPFGQAIVVLVWAARSWAREQSLGGWLPTPEALGVIADRIAAGAQDATQFAAPVPESAPAIHALLIAAAAGTALLVDVLACGVRRVPLAGLPLLAVYTVPVSILSDGVSWWVFAAGALGFLSTMAADQAQRLSHWGRQIGGQPVTEGRFFDSSGTAVSTRAVHASARRIGVVATGLAVLVPIFVPTFGAQLFDGPGSGPGGDGDSVAISNPMVDLRRDLVRGDDVDLLFMETDDPDPSYLRISVLDEFDGETWRPAGRDIPVQQRADGPLPTPPGLDPEVESTQHRYAIEVTDQFGSNWLPTPYPPTFVRVAGDWRYDVRTLDVVSAAEGQTTRGLSYGVRGIELDPSAEQLASAPPAAQEVYARATDLPTTTPALVAQLARDVTEGHTGKLEQAVALQSWFRRDGGFTYSTAREAGNGLDELVQFLTPGPEGRVGYCEQFAAAMAVMSRSLDIPARVAVGFLRPERLGDRSYVYSAHDLHAWPELYFEGVGWVRFEPTPQDRATDVPGYTRGDLDAGGPSAEESAAGLGSRQNRFNRPDGAAVPEQPTAREPGAASGPGPLAWLLPLTALLLLAVTPRLLRGSVRRRRWAAAQSPAEVAEAAWAELRDSALDLGVAWDDTVTLRTRARSLVQSFAADGGVEDGVRLPTRGADANPEATHALERLVKLVEQARYARSVPDSDEVADDVDLCVAALEAGSSKARRLQATWLPASLVTRWTTDRPRRPGSRNAGPAVTTAGVDHAV